MLTLNSKTLLARLLVMGGLMAGVILQAGSNQALADYVPQGGDPPSGNSSTSGMSLS